MLRCGSDIALPSLGVSSLDLGRLVQTSGPFSFLPRPYGCRPPIRPPPAVRQEARLEGRAEFADQTREIGAQTGAKPPLRLERALVHVEAAVDLDLQACRPRAGWP